MKILAIEQSTATASIALLDNNTILSSASWTIQHNRKAHISAQNTTKRKDDIFSLLPTILEKAALSITDIDAFAAGMGPGSFSGIRTSLSSANALALPDKKPVIGISSIKALAYAVMNDNDQDSAAIIGDARRQRFWLAVFSRKQGKIETVTPPMLIEPEKLSEHLNKATILATPDWDRIGDSLKSSPLNLRVIEEALHPSANIIGQLAAKALTSGVPTPTPQPIYMHPPVFGTQSP